MSNKLKGMHIKYRTYYFFDGRINIKNLPPNKIKNQNSHTEIFLFTKLDM